MCRFGFRRGLVPSAPGSSCRLWNFSGGLVPRISRLPFSRNSVLPHPPDPRPLRGRGRTKVFFCKGLRPLQSRICAGSGTAFRYRKPQGQPVTRGTSLLLEPETVRQPANLPAQCRGAGGEAPGKLNQKAPPSPEGKGVGGMGQKSSAPEGHPGDARLSPAKCRGGIQPALPGDIPPKNTYRSGNFPAVRKSRCRCCVKNQKMGLQDGIFVL